jgi:tetratricopeptide (TPR) repeat protein
MSLHVRASCIAVLILELLTVLPLLAQATSKANDEADQLAVAAVLVRDGNYARAETVLQGIDPLAKGTDQVRYRTLKGLVNLRSAKYAEAESEFRLAKSLGQKDATLDAYLAQSLFSQQKYAETRELLNKFARLSAFPDLMGMKCQAEWLLGEKSDAMITLERALKTFPKQLAFLQTKIGFLLELNLTQEAADQARAYLDRAGGQSSAWLTVGESFRRARQPAQAVKVLETARLAFPDQLKIQLSLAQAYLDQGMVRTAAGLLERAGATDPQYTSQAAELYKKAKDFNHALYLNGLLTDTTIKTRQRFSILLDAGRFEEALALVPRLDQMGLLEEGRLRYAAAYTSYRAQKYDQSTRLLSSLTDPQWYAASVQLRKAIEAAKNETNQYF